MESQLTHTERDLDAQTLESLWLPVIELIDGAKRIVISTHENSDGDGLGSEVALVAALKQLGKSVHLVNPTVVPKNYQFLPFMNTVAVFDEKNEAHIQKLHDADLFILLDTNNIGRTRGIKNHVLELRDTGTLKIICIDHHLDPQEFADVMVCISAAAATGELAYELVREMERYFEKPLLTKTVATGIYTAVMTDTASFKLPKTSPRIHRLTAELLEAGVSSMEIYDSVYNTLTPGALKLIGSAIGNIQILEEEQLAYLFVTQAMLQETGVGLSETERLLEYLMGMPKTMIAIMFIELPDGSTKISFRSRAEYAVNQIAKRYGGGGHRNAAGCNVQLSLKETVGRIVREVAELLSAS